MERCEKGRERERSFVMRATVFLYDSSCGASSSARVFGLCEAFVLCVACDCGAVVSGLPAAVMSQATRWVGRVRF